MSYKIDYKFVPIPLDFLNSIINNQETPRSQRILALIYRQIFNTQKEQNKLTISYISKVLKIDRRDVLKSFKSLCESYPFELEDNGRGNANRIILTCGKNATSGCGKNATSGCGKNATGGVAKMPQEHVAKMPHTINIESTIVDSIDNKEMIEMTGDEWR